MQTNNHTIEDYDLVLNDRYGQPGTPQRAKAEEEAKAFYAFSRKKNGLVKALLSK